VFENFSLIKSQVDTHNYLLLWIAPFSFSSSSSSSSSLANFVLFLSPYLFHWSPIATTCVSPTSTRVFSSRWPVFSSSLTDFVLNSNRETQQQQQQQQTNNNSDNNNNLSHRHKQKNSRANQRRTKGRETRTNGPEEQQ